MTTWHSWSLFILSLTGIVAAYFTGWIQWVASVDATQITTLILALFVLASAAIVWLSSGKQSPVLRAFVLFFTDHATALGLVGTVTGLMVMVMTGIPEPELLLVGIGTALTTTLYGLIAAIVLNLQLYLLED